MRKTFPMSALLRNIAILEAHTDRKIRVELSGENTYQLSFVDGVHTLGEPGTRRQLIEYLDAVLEGVALLKYSHGKARHDQMISGLSGDVRVGSIAPEADVLDDDSHDELLAAIDLPGAAWMDTYAGDGDYSSAMAAANID